MTSNNENTEALRDAIVHEFDDWPPTQVFLGGGALAAEPTDAEVEAAAGVIYENKAYLSAEAMATDILRAAAEARQGDHHA